ncbi:MAG: 16S rRNA (guanine(527)-N(7))-methyltransferase RsmG [Deltaproteobacteria bacterium]|nr:16S rRNA (guanine(527)-N(7))-methyltransferase RsmG [Deltaproteobacteria bacterium]
MRTMDRPPLPLPAPAPLEPPEGFTERLRAIGVELEAAVVRSLGDYLAHLLAMNEHMNLTAIVDPAQAWEKHGLDALTLVPLLGELRQGARLVDVGSGGGVPGIPLALARPDLHVTLVEATQKKAAFLVATAAALGLTRVKVRAARAEELARGELRAAFDVVTARAVGKLSALVPLVAPLARPGGLLLLVKGQRADEELADAKQALAQHKIVHEKTVATPTGRIVVLRRRK